MVKSVFFEDARRYIVDFFGEEFPDMTSDQLQKIINSFYRLSFYEEEGVKIRPSIFITSNISALVKNVPNCYRLSIRKDEDDSSFNQRLKALLCFCKNDWHLYINYDKEGGVEYGLVKLLSSIKDVSLNRLIFKSEYTETLAQKTRLININVVSGGMIILTGIKGNKTSICFNLNSQVEYEWDRKIQHFVEACVSKVKTKSLRKLQDIKNIFYNIFQKLFKGLHGTICLIVDKDFVDKKGVFQDGTWLKEPIDFAKLFVQSKNFNEFKLSSYADIIQTMLNYDGITIIDNAGRIRAYNIFIESDQKLNKKVVGGARRRASETLLNMKSRKIVGVYFQSQDGDNFYKYAEYYKRLNKKNDEDDSQEHQQDVTNELLPIEELLKDQQQQQQIAVAEVKNLTDEEHQEIEDALIEKNDEETEK